MNRVPFMNNEQITRLTIAAGLAYVAAYVAYKILLEVWCVAYGLFY